jgi:hypothetical protein
LSNSNINKDAEKRVNHVTVGSDRSFGIVFTIFFLLVALLVYLKGLHSFWPWLTASVVFLVISLLRPTLFHPLNLIWFKFGLILHSVINPIVLGLMFYVVFTPMGFLMRTLNKRPLNLQFDPSLQSYWIVRKPPSPQADSFFNQF